MWADLYKCPKCTVTWEVTGHDDINFDRDSVEHELTCDICGSLVSEKALTPEGKQLVHMLSPEEIERIASQSPEDIETDEEV